MSRGNVPTPIAVSDLPVEVSNGVTSSLDRLVKYAVEPSGEKATSVGSLLVNAVA